jgi:hypothetical protein
MLWHYFYIDTVREYMEETESLSRSDLFCLVIRDAEGYYCICSHTRHIPHSVGLLWTSDRTVAETCA